MLLTIKSFAPNIALIPCEFSAVTCNGASAAFAAAPICTKPADQIRTLSCVATIKRIASSPCRYCIKPVNPVSAVSLKKIEPLSLLCDYKVKQASCPSVAFPITKSSPPPLKEVALVFLILTCPPE